MRPPRGRVLGRNEGWSTEPGACQCGESTGRSRAIFAGGHVEEEHALHSAGALEDQAQARLNALRVELDQCWDLLRQRRALREFGDDPDKAKVRPPGIVENYKQ